MGSALVAPLNPALPETAYAEELTLQQQAEVIALEVGISTTTFFNLIESETGGTWNPKAYNKKTQDRGIVQINRIWHPEVSDACAFDATCALRWAAERIKKGFQHEWTPCSCIQTARALGVKIPPKHDAEDLMPNSPPIVGGLVLLKYGRSYHIAVIQELGEEKMKIREGNFLPCKIGYRSLSYGDKAIRGFWTPPIVEKVE